MTMEVLVAQYAGACYGVERALKLVKTAAADEPNGPVHTLGPLIHNPQVVEELRSAGVEVADTLDDAESGTLVIRSHGVVPSVIEDALKKGLTVVDATCPHVSKAHKAAEKLHRDGYLVIVVGEAGHPEVEGILAYAGSDAIVAATSEDLPRELPSRKIGIVVQTTQSAEALSSVVDAVLLRASELKVLNTICFATKQRQHAAAELAAQVDAMFVVGGRNSGNTRRLFQICGEVCDRTYHIETPAEIDASWLEGCGKVGVTAGASTPEKQITDVIAAIKAFS